MMFIGIIGLTLLLAITIPTYEKWSYRAMYKQGEQNEKEEKYGNN